MNTIDRIRDSIFNLKSYISGDRSTLDSLQAARNRNYDLLTQIRNQNSLIENYKVQLESMNNSPSTRIYESIDAMLDTIDMRSNFVNTVSAKSIANSFDRGNYQIFDAISNMDSLINRPVLSATAINSIQLSINKIEQIVGSRANDIKEALNNKQELELLLSDVTKMLQKISKKR